MQGHSPLDEEGRELSSLLARVQAYAASALETLGERPAARAPASATTAPLADRGIGLTAALDEFAERWAPGFSGSAGPRYLGFVTGGATPAAIAGDWLTSIYDQNPTSGLDSSAPDLERETLRWLRELVGLPETFSGSFVSGATMSNFVGLAIGREWIGEQRGISVAQSGVAALGPVKILSGAPHSSIYKAASMLGLGRDAITTLPLQADREAVDVDALERALRELDGAAAIVVANLGTVNTVDFDDLHAIAALRQRYPFWLHVDAAFGAFAALSPVHAHLVEGLALADSVCVDLHKWLNVPYDSAVQFSRRPDLQVRVFQNAAAYLGMPTANPDFVHLTPENSRRLRALAAWFALRAYGRAGHADIVQRNVAMAARLGAGIAADPRLVLLAPVRLNVVCFTLAAEPSQTRVNELVKLLRDDGTVFLTPTVYRGQWALRAAFSNWRTGEEDVEQTLAALSRALDQLASPSAAG